MGNGIGQNDFSDIRGANYLPSYALNTVEIWRDFDPDAIDRELGYAERLELNSLRTFPQYLLYEKDPAGFLRKVETFVSLCDKHGIRPMLAIFDGCFGVAPSMETAFWWVGSPGGPRTNPAFYPQGERYCQDLVNLFRGDSRLLMWDAMNEPEAATFYAGEETAYAFAAHFAEFLRAADGTHPVTVGMAHAENNAHVIGAVDVVSFHPYAQSAEDLAARIARAREVAAGKPIVASETGMPFWGCPYDLVLPALRAEGIGTYFFELMIGRDVCAPSGGIFYPDGTVRRLSHVEAVLGRPPRGFVKKPDREGVPLGQVASAAEFCAPLVRRMMQTPVTDENAAERYSFLWSVANPHTVSAEEAEYLKGEVQVLREALEAGHLRPLYPKIESLLREAASFHWATQSLFHPDIVSIADDEGSA